MILIRKIEVEEVPDDYCEIMKLYQHDPSANLKKEFGYVKYPDVQVEEIRRRSFVYYDKHHITYEGRVFFKPWRKKIVIGIPKKYDRLIGLPFECLESRGEWIDSLFNELKQFKDKTKWQWIKFAIGNLFK